MNSTKDQTHQQKLKLSCFQRPFLGLNWKKTWQFIRRCCDWNFNMQIVLSRPISKSSPNSFMFSKETPCWKCKKTAIFRIELNTYFVDIWAFPFPLDPKIFKRKILNIDPSETNKKESISCFMVRLLRLKRRIKSKKIQY